MKRIFAITVTSLLVLVGCGDGVPKIDDPHNVTVDGKKMTQADFLQTYCVGKATSETCDKVKNAMSKDATKGVIPRF